MSSYLHSAMLWLGALTTSSRALAPHPQCESYKKTNSISYKDLPEVELEMHVVGGGVPQTPTKIHHEHEETMSTNTGPNAASTSGHSRSKSESSAFPRNSGRRADLASITPPRARVRGSRHTHSRTSSSFAPIIVVPGIVNSSFFLFPPEPKPRPTAKNMTPKRRLESFSEKRLEEERIVGRDTLLSEEEEEALANESSHSHSRSSSSSNTSSRSTSASGSSRSRSSFDSFGSQSSGSYTSYSSDEHNDTEECSHRHHAPRVLEGD